MRRQGSVHTQCWDLQDRVWATPGPGCAWCAKGHQGQVGGGRGASVSRLVCSQDRSLKSARNWQHATSGLPWPEPGGTDQRKAPSGPGVHWRCPPIAEPFWFQFFASALSGLVSRIQTFPPGRQPHSALQCGFLLGQPWVLSAPLLCTGLGDGSVRLYGRSCDLSKAQPKETE